MDGNEILIAHLDKLLEDASAGHFDDFKSDFEFPKLYLISRLEALIANTKSGKYD